MGIVNRRNAVVGWAAWKIVKGVGKRRAKAVLPGRSAEREPNALALLVAAALGAGLWLWLRGNGDDPEE